MRRDGGRRGRGLQGPGREVGAALSAVQAHPPCPPCPVALRIVWEMTSVNICQSETAR